MDADQLYKEFGFSPAEVENGDELYRSLKGEMRQIFISTVQAHWNVSLYPDGEIPAESKVAMIHFALDGTYEEKINLALQISNACQIESIQFLFPLAYFWALEEKDPRIVQCLSRGLLFYLDRPQVQALIKSNLYTHKNFALGAIDWLHQQPKWFREKHLEQERKLWQEIQQRWPLLLDDEYKVHQINNYLGLSVHDNVIWSYDIDNPWSFTIEPIKELAAKGIPVRIIYPPSEICMGGPQTTTLVWGADGIPEEYGGPFVLDDQFEYLCCTKFEKNKGGFKLIIINLRTIQIKVVDTRSSTYAPYDYVNGCFRVILKSGKIDFSEDILYVNARSGKVVQPKELL